MKLYTTHELMGGKCCTHATYTFACYLTFSFQHAVCIQSMTEPTCTQLHADWQSYVQRTALPLCHLLYTEPTHTHLHQIGNRTCSALLFLSVIGIILPTGAHQMLHVDQDSILAISRGTSLVLLLCYVSYLFFQLRTHHELFHAAEVRL